MTDKTGPFYLSNAVFHPAFKPYTRLVRLVPSPKDPDLGVLSQDSMGEVGGREHPESLSHGCNAPSCGDLPPGVPRQNVAFGGCLLSEVQLLGIIPARVQGPASPPTEKRFRAMESGFSRLSTP